MAFISNSLILTENVAYRACRYFAGLLGVLTVLRAIGRQDAGVLRAEALQAVVLKALMALGQRRQRFTGVLMRLFPKLMLHPARCHLLLSGQNQRIVLVSNQFEATYRNTSNSAALECSKPLARQEVFVVHELDNTRSEPLGL